jgi:hypothetical protein
MPSNQQLAFHAEPSGPGFALRHDGMWRLNRARTALFLAVGAATIAMLIWTGLATLNGNPTTAESAEPADGRREGDKPLRADKREVSEAERARLLVRAHVWARPSVPVRKASFVGETLEEATCRFKVSELGGTTPKFDCELPDGEEVRIKYGNGPEVPAEAAATRLLRGLGFAADHIQLVRRLRCYGCPEEPFSTMRAVDLTRAETLYKTLVDYNDYEDFAWVALERKFNGRPIETDTIEGWSFFELDTVDGKSGGAPRPHLDALRVMAVLLAHWDNKSENQRMVCVSRQWTEGTPCPQPFLLLQDVGATFGPTKLDLEAWQQVPMWDDRATCALSMRTLPFDGATFGQAVISEAGRRFISDLLSELSDAQLTELFTHARFAERRGLFAPTHPVSEWVRTFKTKVRAISEGPPCPVA